MDRMKYHHHKCALTLTIILVAILGVVLGLQIEKSAQSYNPLIIMEFGFILVLLVLVFILLSVVLRSREELFMIHQDLRDCIRGCGHKDNPMEKLSGQVAAAPQLPRTPLARTPARNTANRSVRGASPAKSQRVTKRR